MTDEATRDALRAKIDAGERRNEDRSFGTIAAEARDDATNFAKEHPVATVVAGITIGVLIAGFFNRGKVARGASRFGSMAAEMGSAYGLGLIDAARNGQDRIEDFGDTVGAKARSARRETAHQANIAGDAARIFGRRAARKAGRGVRNVRNKVGL